MTIFTIGFTQKNAQQFFEIIKKSKIELLIDVRLNNKSQLAGFTKGNDLAYFLKQICNCDYEYRVDMAPTKDILDGYKKGLFGWKDYEERFIPLIQKRQIAKDFLKKYSKYTNICLLCSEKMPTQCHRRLVAEEIVRDNPSVQIVHL